MKSFVKRMITAIGGVAIAAFLLMLAAPKTAHAIVSTLVTVANTAANPVPTRATDNPARLPVVLSATITIFDGEPNDQAVFHTDTTTSYTVPDGFRLVIDSYSGQIGVPNGQAPVESVISSDTGTVIYPVATFQGSNGGSNFSLAGQLTTYVDPGGQLTAFCERGPSFSGQALATFIVSGHLESIQ